MPRERELKLDIQPAAAPRVLQYLRRQGAKSGKTRNTLTIYFDSPDFALRGAGVTLRIRRTGSRYIQNIKAADPVAAGLFDRTEWESAVPGFSPDLHQLKETGLKHFAKKPLPEIRPVFEVRTRRTDFRLPSAPGLLISLDRGRVIAGEARLPFCELEIETPGGSDTDLFALARGLSRGAPVRLGLAAKSDRGYALLQPPGHGAVRARDPALSPSMPAGEAFRVIARECLRQFAVNVPGTLRREAEALHQTRVALRRLRAAMSLFSGISDGEDTKAIKAELKWIGHCLGEARDLDVALDDAAPPAINSGAVARELQAERSRAYDHVARAMGSRRFRHLLVDLLCWIECGSWLKRRDAASKQPVRAHANSELDRRHRKLSKQVARLRELHPLERHAVRIRGKRLRYGVEFFGGIFAGRKNSERRHSLLSALKELQHELGVLNDIATGENLIAEVEAASDAVKAAPAATDQEVEKRLDAAMAAGRKIARAKPFWS